MELYIIRHGETFWNIEGMEIIGDGVAVAKKDITEMLKG